MYVLIANTGADDCWSNKQATGPSPLGHESTGVTLIMMVMRRMMLLMMYDENCVKCSKRPRRSRSTNRVEIVV